MTIWVPITLYGLPMLSVLLFGLLQPRQAALWTFLLAHLFLPMASYKFPLMPAYDKGAAASLGVLLGALIFDNAHIMRFRPSWYDIPIVVFCVVPFFSCLSADLGVFNGIAAAITSTLKWGAPYFVGRIYFTTPAGLRILAIGIVIGGLIYVPFCLYEARMAPTLHSTIYGFHQHSFAQERRYGGFRPTVFMQHGLAVAAWMSATATIAFWLWRLRFKKSLFQIPMVIVFLMLVVVVIICKTTGAFISMLIGISPILVKRFVGLRVPLLILALLPPAYMVARTAGVLSSTTILNANSTFADADRTSSLSVRLRSEDITLPRILERPLLGYGWGQYQSDVITDGMWIIVFGRCGLVGLTAWTLIFILPTLLFCKAQYSGRSADYGIPLVLCLLLCLHLLDDLMNAMFNPMFVIVSGALLAQAATPFVTSVPKLQKVRPAQAAREQRARTAISRPPIPRRA